MRLPQRVAIAAGHDVEAEANQLDNGAFARAARADQTIEPVAEFNVGAVQEAAENAESANAMEGGVFHCESPLAPGTAAALSIKARFQYGFFPRHMAPRLAMRLISSARNGLPNGT